ncbi:hypothetical protein I4U23_025702 [Adineta vaga]|nr:hypothetical protein I4U23_025702 [Adineta vaga]
MLNSSWTYFGLASLDTTIFMHLQPFNPNIGTSTMYDVLAAILSLYHSKTIIMITNDGYTQINATQEQPVQSTVMFQC